LEKEGEHLLDWTKEVKQWQNRVLSLRKWNPDQNWPDVSTQTLLQNIDAWLGPYLLDVKKTEDLKRIDLKKFLQQYLSYEKQQLLQKLAPERIEVPSGSNIKVSYKSNGDAPVFAVRLQEVFGWVETPTVNQGRINLLMHLLSPGFKPVQITGDLKSFWTNAYFEVKKELKARYPKHHWPDDPLNAKPNRK
jgi:ATP-dependent helicase HrpB